MTRLIACVVLFLLATPLPSNLPQTEKPARTTDQPNCQSKPSPLNTNELGPSRSASGKNDYANYYNYPSSKSESPPVWFQEIAAGFIILLTAGLCWTSIQQWRAINTQANIARDALTKLEVPLISPSIAPNGVFFAELIESKRRPFVRYGFKNDGRAVAELTSVCALVRIYSNLPPTPDYDGGRPDHTPFFIGPESSSEPIEWSATADSTVGEDDWSRIKDRDNLRIVFFGYVKYRGQVGHDYTRGWAFEYTHHNRGVALTGGRSYNYNRQEGQGK